jgi:hypothetical protein
VSSCDFPAGRQALPGQKHARQSPIHIRVRIPDETAHDGRNSPKKCRSIGMPPLGDIWIELTQFGNSAPFRNCAARLPGSSYRLGQRDSHTLNS